MSAMARADDAAEVGHGPLSRGAAVVYRLLVLQLLLLLACSPSVVLLLLLDRDPSNVPLAVLALLPLAPALVAGVAAVRAWPQEDDLSPARPFLRAYRRDVGATLKWWVPALLLLAVLSFNLVHTSAVAGGAVLLPVLLVLLAMVAVWCGQMVVLTACFHLRTRDAARIAVAEAVPQWRFTLGVLGLLVVAGAVLLTSEIVLLLLAWAFVGLLALMARGLVDDVTERFTRR